MLEFNPQTMQITWQYSGTRNNPLYTFAYGRVQILENGNYLITETLGSRVLEITRSGEIVWEYKLPRRYTKIDPDMPPYKKTNPRRRSAIEADLINVEVNMISAILSAEQYQRKDLHFLDK